MEGVGVGKKEGRQSRAQAPSPTNVKEKRHTSSLLANSRKRTRELRLQGRISSRSGL